MFDAEIMTRSVIRGALRQLLAMVATIASELAHWCLSLVIGAGGAPAAPMPWGVR